MIPLGECPAVWRGKNAFVVYTVSGYHYCYFRGNYLNVRPVSVHGSCAMMQGVEDLPEADEAMVAISLHSLRHEKQG